MRKNLISAILSFGVAAGGCVAVCGQAAQTPAAGQAQQTSAAQDRAIGVVMAIDAADKTLKIKTDAGAIVVAAANDKTVVMRVPPGDKDTKRAVAITLTDIALGDRVFVFGKPADGGKIATAKVYVMTKADLARKAEHDRAEWQQRGVTGTITAINPATKEITLQLRQSGGRGFGGGGFRGGAGAAGGANGNPNGGANAGAPATPPSTITIAASAPNVVIRRYAPDSVKFSDAKPSSFDEMKVGDQLRALGDKSEDGSRLTAEEVVFGTFRTFAGTVTAVNAQTNEVQLTDMQTNRKITVAVTPDSNLRRFPAEMMQRMMARAQGGEQGGANGEGAGRPPREGGAANGGEGGTRRGGGGEGAGGEGAGRGRGFGGRGFDPQAMLEFLPQTTVADLKPGDVVIVGSTVGNDPSRATATAMIAGADAIVAMMRARGAVAGAGAGAGAAGGFGGFGQGGFDLGIGLP